MTTLVIVESPKKAKEIGKFLGEDYTVMASYGHVRDLPGIGKDADELVVGIGRDFSARYVINDKSRMTVTRLRAASANASKVVLATDPDREGEAIAWHLQQVLKLRNPDRVTYTEVTAKAVKTALAKPRALDLDLVRAQEARRVLDRIIGYSVSPILGRESGLPLSAGRVQTPALRLVVEREREIRTFTQRLHFGAELGFSGGWSAQWMVKLHLQEEQDLWTDEDIALRVAGIRQLLVKDFADGSASEAPPAPFTTSTLQQEASKLLGLKVKETMDLAQALFDGALITYHRTDSPNYSDESRALICAYAQDQGLPIEPAARRWKAKASAQEGHDAIRPINMAVEEAGDNEQERALYRLIRARSLASQLVDAVYATRHVVLQAVGDELVNGVPPHFEARGRVLVEQGWRKVYAGNANDHGEDSDADSELSNPIPLLEPGALIEANSGRKLDKKTRPRVRFTEAGLVKELEACGIGRPSTYASIINSIQSRGYVEPDKATGKYLVPTQSGEAVVDALVSRFAFAEYDYTKELEDQLDHIAQQKTNYHTVIATAWESLEKEIVNLNSASLQPIPVTNPCPTCKKSMRRIKGDYGYFWACTDRNCKTTLPDDKGKPGKRKTPPAPTGFKCPKCGKELARRQGISTPKKRGLKGTAYDFYSCTGYPKCDSKFKTGRDGGPVLGDEANPESDGGSL